MNSNNLESSNLSETSSTLTNENLEKTEVSEATSTSVDYETKNEEEISENNGLENFELSDDDTPELFNSDANEDLSTSPQEINSEEEDLEIPAFLRRQKN